MTSKLDKRNCAVYVELEDLDGLVTPDTSDIESWIALVFESLNIENCELSILLCSEETIHDLNLRFREKDKTTNVLSFPSDVEHEIRWLGDIAICAKVVNNEAIEQGKTSLAHWAHMTIHGCLHLLGYDHIEDSDAVEMESLEIELLSKLNIPNPYLLS